MRLLIGCSGAIALVAFIIGFTASAVISGGRWTESVATAAMVSIITFAAALYLAAEDSVQHSSTIRKVRANLLSCNDSTDEQFISFGSCDDVALLLETRRAISRFFDVPTVKVGRNVHLIHDLHVDELEPAFQFYVVHSVIASQPAARSPFVFTMAGLASIDDLAQAIRKVIDSFANTADMTGNATGSRSEVGLPRGQYPFVAAFGVIVVVQFMLAIALAPGDGMRLLRWWISFLALLDIVVYFVGNALWKRRLGRMQGFLVPTFLVVGICSVGVIFVGTYIVEAFGLR